MSHGVALGGARADSPNSCAVAQGAADAGPGSHPHPRPAVWTGGSKHVIRVMSYADRAALALASKLRAFCWTSTSRMTRMMTTTTKRSMTTTRTQSGAMPSSTSVMFLAPGKVLPDAGVTSCQVRHGRKLHAGQPRRALMPEFDDARPLSRQEDER
jgi:hypothetical protein